MKKETKSTLLAAALAAAGMMGFGISGSLRATEPFAVTDLRCGGQVEPLGIDDDPLLLGWRIEGDGRGLKQLAYRVLVASSPDLLAEGKADLWDSGKVESGESQWVKYGGKAPGSARRVHWRVEVWPALSGVEGPTIESLVSKPSWFETGLLQPSDWTAHWIETDPAMVNDGATEQWADYALFRNSGSEKVEEHKHKVLQHVRANTILRREFTLDDVPVSARLRVTAKGFYTVFVNGERLDDFVFEPSFGYAKASDLVRVHDVTRLLKRGPNEVRVNLSRGRNGYLHPNNH